MNNLFNWHFWFNLRPGPLSRNSDILMGALIILLAALFTFLKMMKNKGYNNKMWSGLAEFSFTNVFLACILLFFTTENVPFFAARFWFLVWLAEIIFWLWLIFKKKQKAKVMAAQASREQEIKKYLPK